MQHTSFTPWSWLLVTAIASNQTAVQAAIISPNMSQTAPNNKFLFNGIDYYQGSWEDTQREATTRQQLVFVEIFAENYAPSRLIGDLLSIPAVSDYYNNNFINYRVNINSYIGKEFMKNYHVQSAGELLFFDHEGKLLLRQNGATDANKLLSIAKSVNKQNTLDILTEEYSKGTRKSDFLYEYAYQLRLNKQPHDQIVNEYINKEKLQKHKCTEVEDLKFVYDFASNLRTEAIDVLLKNKKVFEEQFGADKVASKIDKAISTAANYAVEAHDETMLQRACEVAEKNAAPNKMDMIFDMKWQYYESIKDRKNQAKIAQDYMQQYKAENPVVFHQKAVALLQVAGNDAELWKTAQKWLEKSIELMPNYHNQKDYARLLMHLGDYATAKKMAEKAIAIAKISNIDYSEAQRMIEIITTPTMKGSVRL
jgi:thioredoxin-related protein